MQFNELLYHNINTVLLPYHQGRFLFNYLHIPRLSFCFCSVIRKTKAEFNKKVLANFKDIKSESFLLSLDEQWRDQPQKVDNQDTLLKTSPTILFESRILQRGQDKNVIVYSTIQSSLRSLKQT